MTFSYLVPGRGIYRDALSATRLNWQMRSFVVIVLLWLCEWRCSAIQLATHTFNIFDQDKLDALSN